MHVLIVAYPCVVCKIYPYRFGNKRLRRREKKVKEGFVLVAKYILSCRNVAKHRTLFQYYSQAAYKINEVVT